MERIGLKNGSPNLAQKVYLSIKGLVVYVCLISLVVSIPREATSVYRSFFWQSAGYVLFQSRCASSASTAAIFWQFAGYVFRWEKTKMNGMKRMSFLAGIVECLASESKLY